MLLPLFAAVIAALIALHLPGQPDQADALQASLNFPKVACAGQTASVSFSWLPVPGALQQWLDLSPVDDNFQSAASSAAGPLSSGQNSYTWSGLTAGAVYYWRVNALMDGGWATSLTGTFVPCGGPVLLWGPMSCNNPGSAGVHFRWAPSATNIRQQYLDVGPDPSFAPGTFIAAGPLSPERDQYFWDNLPAGLRYYFRVNALGADNIWRSTIVANFETACGGAPQVNTDLRGSNDVLTIARLGIQAPVTVRNIGADGVMGNPAGPWDAVRYNWPLYDLFGGYPGEGGVTVMAAHVDHRPNLMAAFWELRHARPGDIIDYARGDGVHVQYAVDWITNIEPGLDLNALVTRTPQERIVLITCEGVFNPVTREYDLRLILHGTRVN